MTQVKGITIEIGADTVKFDEGIKGTKKALSLLGNEAKNINKQLRLDPKNVDLLNSKLKTLTQQQEVTRKKLEQYQNQLAEMGDEEIGSDKWIALKKAINNTETELKQFDTQINKTQNELDSISNTKIKIDSAQGKKALDEIKNKAEETKRKLTEVGDGFKTAGQNLLPVTGAIAAGLGFGVKNASDLSESLNKTEVAFGKNAKAVIDFSKNSETKFGQLQGDVLDSAATFGLLGVDAEKSMNLVTRAVDISSISNVNFADVQSDIQSALNGSTEVMEKYGVKLKQVDLAQYLVEQGIAGTTDEAVKMLESMDSNTKQMVFYEKILSDTAYAQDDFNNTSEGFANSFRIVTAQVKDIALQLGEVLLPILTEFLNKVKEWLTGFQNLNASQKELIVKMLLLIAAIGPLLIIIGSIISAVAPVIAIFQAFMGAVTVFGGVLPAFSALFPVLTKVIGALLGPIGIAIALFILLYTQSEEFRKFINLLINTALNILIAVFKTLVSIIQNVVLPILTALWTWFKTKIIPIINDVFRSINSTLIPVFNSISNVIRGTVIPILTQLWTWFQVYILPVLSALAKVIGNVVIIQFMALKLAIILVIGYLKTIFGVIKQVWSVFKETSQFESMVNGFNSIKTVVEVVSGTVAGLLNIIGNITGAIGGALGKVSELVTKINPFKSGGFGFEAGGFGFEAGGFGGSTSLALTTNINVHNSGSNITETEIMKWSTTIIDIVDEGLGRRG